MALEIETTGGTLWEQCGGVAVELQRVSLLPAGGWAPQEPRGWASPIVAVDDDVEEEEEEFEDGQELETEEEEEEFDEEDFDDDFDDDFEEDSDEFSEGDLGESGKGDKAGGDDSGEDADDAEIEPEFDDED